MKIFLWVLVVIMLISGGYFFIQNTEKVSTDNLSPATYEGAPTFSWQYEPFMDGEFPKTEISLMATYENGALQTKVIDSVDGSCNDYADPDKDVYEHSTMIICYAAGLGHYFKVVDEDGKYLVMRKTFEEGSPEYTPPEEAYETIAQF